MIWSRTAGLTGRLRAAFLGLWRGVFGCVVRGFGM